jgi:hypothetical protein
MKIPSGTYISSSHPIWLAWQAAATKLAIEYGIWIEPIKQGASSANLDDGQSLYFQIGDKQFESLRDLRKALKNKAFL